MLYEVRIFIKKNLSNKDFSTYKSRVDLKSIYPFFISASYYRVNPIQDFKITLTQSDN